MQMIFLGDVNAVRPFPVVLEPSFRASDLVVANLEGPIVTEHTAESVRRESALALYNSPDILGMLDAFGVRAVSLANNHILDLPVSIVEQKMRLNEAGIRGFGVGSTIDEACEPYRLSRRNTTVKLFGFGWDVIGCQVARTHRQGVNPFSAEHTLDAIRRLRKVDKFSFVAFIIHWNYELEFYPQPAHRQLAQALIREGVDAVIGLHPHIAQGAELFEGKPIVYSLGNWFFPVRQCGHFQLAYPPTTSRQLALELEIKGRQIESVKFHWHQFDASRNRVHFENTESWSGSVLQSLTPYAELSHSEYIRWFREHRTRRHGLPIYTDYRHSWRNRAKDQYVKVRQALIQMLVRARLKRRLSA